MNDAIRKVVQAKLRIPVWVLVALALVAAATFTVRSYALARVFELHVYFPEAYDLKQGAAVICDGLTIGRVGPVRLVPIGPVSNPARRVDVALRIDRRYREMIGPHSSATPVRQGLLGDEMIAISRRDSSQLIPTGGELEGVPPATGALSSALATSLAGCFQQVAKDINSTGKSVK